MCQHLIIVKSGIISQIAKEHKVDRHTVAKALKGDSSVLKCELLRAVALQKGGIEYQPVKK